MSAKTLVHSNFRYPFVLKIQVPAILAFLIVVGFSPTRAEANQPPILRTTKVFQQQDSVEEGQPYQGCQDAWFWSSYNRDWSYDVIDNSIRTVIRFSNLSIPAESMVQEAVLEMYMHELGDGSGRSVFVYGVKKDWVVNEVTGVEYRSGYNWEMEKGDGPTDRTQVAADTVQLTSQPDWQTWDVTSIAQSWTSGEFDNNGFMLVGEEDPNWNDQTWFHAEQYGANEDQRLLRPKLIISWSPSVIPNQVLSQPLSYQDLFDLDDYYYDPDGDSLSYSCVGATHVEVTIDEENRVDMVLEQDWIGTEQIQFVADDGYGGTVSSNEIQITVQGVSAIIPNQRWRQGYSFDNALNLDNYFFEEGLTFGTSTEDNPNIDVTINPDHTVSFNQPSSFYGSESVVFTGTGSQGEYVSNPVLLTVDKPEYETVLTSHPKIFICPANIDDLEARAEGPLSSLYNSLLSQAGGYRDKTYGWYGFLSDTALEDIVMCGYLYHMTGDVAYANTIISAMEWLPNYDGASSSPTNKASTLEGLALGFDMAYDRIVELGRKEEFVEDIITFADREKQNLIDALYTDFHNYFTHKSTAVLFAGLALYGEHPKAVEYLDFALECFRGDLTNTGTAASLLFLHGDGCWEGSTYARVSLWHMNRFVKGWQTGNNNAVNWYHTILSEFENSGYALIYYLRPDNLMVKVGDYTYPWAQDKQAFPLWAFQGEYQNPYFTWICENTWVDSLHGIWLNSGLDKDNTWYKRKVWALLWWDPSVPAADVANLPLTRDYKTGEVIMRSDWTDDATYLMFKRPTYHFGGHLHLDQNSFTVFKNGPLVTHSGYFSSTEDHRWNYYRRSVAHNLLLVKDSSYSIIHGNANNMWMDFYNDGGYRFVWTHHDPPHTTERGWSNEPRWLPDGSVVALTQSQREDFFMGTGRHQATAEFDYCFGDVTASFTNAYTGQGDNEPLRVKDCVRHFVYLRPENLIVIFDRVISANPDFQKSWLLHSLDAPNLWVDGEWLVAQTGIHDYATDLVRIDVPEDRAFGSERGRLFCKTLLPAQQTHTTIGGPGYEFWMDGANRETDLPSGSRALEDPVSWRFEVRPTVPDTLDYFLHVLYPTTTQSESMPSSNLVSAGADVAGVVVDGRVVVFAKGRQPLLSAQYTVSGSGSHKHLVCGLEPNRDYQIKEDESPVGTAYASEEGAVFFTRSLTGSKTYLITASDDTTAPAPITDLAAEAGSVPKTIRLTWTAPGDDGEQGQAASYHIRRWDSPITEATWNQAIPVANPPSPGPGETDEAFLISQLSSGVTHYFALKSEDESHNLSAISNSPGAIPLADTVAPQISGVQVADLGETTATIRWETDEEATSVVDYGLSSSCSLSTPVDTAFVQSHAVSLQGLYPGAFYYYQAVSEDPDGNRGESAVLNFTTPRDEVPPAILSVTAVSATQVDVQFSEPIEEVSAEDQANYEIDHGIVVFDADLDLDLATVHLTTGQHVEGVIYTITVNDVRDRASNPNPIASNSTASYQLVLELEVSNLSKGEYQTGTLAVGDQYYVDRTYTLVDIPPEYEGLLWIKTANDDKNNASEDFLSFTVNQDVTVYVGYDNRASSLPFWITDHYAQMGVGIGVSDVAASPLQLWSRDFPAGPVVMGGNMAEGASGALTMYVVLLRGHGSVADTVAPLISQVMVTDIADTEATIQWVTDELSDSQVEYGFDVGYGFTSPLDPTLTLNHQVIIHLPPTTAKSAPSSGSRAGQESVARGSGASPDRQGEFFSTKGDLGGVVYHYRVLSRDPYDNLAVSGDDTFVVFPGDTTPPSILSLQIWSVMDTSAQMGWETDEPARAALYYGLERDDYQWSLQDTSLTTAHQFSLEDLTPATIYHLQAWCEDEPGNWSVSPDTTLVTKHPLTKAPGRPAHHDD